MNNKLILVIEDNPLNMKLVKQLIQIAHYHVAEAYNAEDGIQLARKKQPDLILLDVQLPGMDGLSASKVIKNDPATKNIPIIALTAHAMRGDELKAKAAGCDAYLSKPIDTKVFFKTLDTYLKNNRKAEDVDVAEETVCQGAPTIMVVDDEPLNVKLLSAKLGASGYRTLKAYSGLEALNIIEKTIPDLVLLDIMMPEMDGYAVIKKLKNRRETKNIPIVLITALEGEEEKAKGLAAGADEFLNKPVNTAELETRVLSLLRMKKYQEQLNAREQAEKDLIGKPKHNASIEKHINAPTVLLVEDDKKDAQLISNHLKKMPIHLQIVRTGSEALKKLQYEKIDLLLLDLILPDIDGISICRKVKNNEKTMSVQVVIVTTLDDLKVKIRGIEEGADDFLLKPLNCDEIKARVKALLKKKAFIDKLNNRADVALKAAITDKLTGLHNYAFFRHFIGLEIKRSLRHENKMALLMIDVDNFKQFNDTYGHPEGDRALHILGRLIKESVRDVDLAARYGGEEFVVVLPYSGWQSGKQVADRLLEKINSQRITVEDSSSEPIRLSVSIGLAVFPDNGMTAESIINAADTALYHAKNCGKNRTCCAEVPNKSALYQV